MPETDALRTLVAEVQAAQSDVEPFLARHTEDTIIVNLAGRRVLGQDTLREAMTAALATPLAQVITTAEVDDIRFVRPDVAIVSATKHVADRREDGDAVPARGRLTYVAVHEGDEWRIALAQTTPVLE
ncbi:MAG TPA: SgcJ/EcaC family oxidoreductase [Iamia sp.]